MKRLLLILLFLPVIGRSQIITTIAGDGARGSGGDGRPATIAQLNLPICLTFDDHGNSYIVDIGNDNIRKIAANGAITTIAGSRHLDGSFRLADDSTYGNIKENIPATNALVWKPHGIAADDAGNVYFTEYETGTIRKISADGIISTFAGQPQQFATQLDEGIKITGKIGLPGGIAIDGNDNLYYTDELLNVVRKISKDGIITTVAGNGNSGYTGDDDMGTRARLNKPMAVAVDNEGNIYITDNENERVRKVSATGTITTIAGNGQKGYEGDGGPATDATLNDPRGIAVDRWGNVYVADSRNDAIRRISASGIISTFAGGHQPSNHAQDMRNSGDGGPAITAQLHWPYGVAVDTAGNVYIAEDQHHVVRKVTAPPHEKKALPPPPVEKLPIKEREPNEAIDLAVDPEQGVLTITIDSNAYASLTITDSKNNVLVQQPITNVKTSVDISTLPSALYYVTLKGKDRVKSVGFVKN